MTAWYPAIRPWRDTARAAAVDELERIAKTRFPPPPPEPLVEVEALAATWCIGGKPVTVGCTYRVPRSAAASLEHVGKARIT
jgi:hypothetical protein